MLKKDTVLEGEGVEVKDAIKSLRKTVQARIDPFENSSVIRFKATYRNIPAAKNIMTIPVGDGNATAPGFKRAYTFAALRCSNDLWYVTGESHSGRAYTYMQLIDWVTTNLDLLELEVATDWESVL